MLWYMAAALGVIVAQFEYHETDTFDQIDHLFRSVTPDNCYIKPLVSTGSQGAKMKGEGYGCTGFWLS